MNVFELIEKHGIELHGDIEYFAELIRQEKNKWVGLTEADIYELMDNEDEFEFAKAIEAKLKEKNNG